MRSAHALIMGFLGLTVACGSAPPASTYGSRDKGGADDDDDAPNGNGQFGGETTETPSASSTTPAGVSEVWSHSADTLYRLDPVTKEVTVVGRFSGCATSVIDIALDAQSNIYATTFGSLERIDKATARCTTIAMGQYPNSLSFVPKGTVDPNEEALVGYVGASYVRIDTKTGAVTTIGALGGLGGAGMESSGDIVSVTNGPTYLTVVGPTCADCIVEVDPKTGAITKNWGPLAHSDVYGIAFWAGSVYAFDAAGGLFEVTFTGGKLGTKAIPIPNAANLEFFGAGSTTSAPVTATR
jgi:hypothetical protein